MRKWTIWILLAVVAVLGGCAHPISLGSDMGQLTGGGPKLDRKVGLVYTDEMRAREVTTPGGGGDKVSYRPYRDMETGLYVALGETFASVSRVTGVADAKVRADGLNLLVQPTLTTTSYSPSLLTWPPTIFTVQLDCELLDASGKSLTRLKVQGEGRAEFDEFKGNASLSAKRAAESALKSLMAALREAVARLP